MANTNYTVRKLLTKEEAATYLHISAPTLDRWMRAGKLVPIRFGRTVRFSQEHLDALAPYLTKYTSTSFKPEAA